MKLDPDNASTRRNLAEVYLVQGSFEKALVEICEAIDIDPSVNEYYRKRAQIYRQLGRIEEAQQD